MEEYSKANKGPSFHTFRKVHAAQLTDAETSRLAGQILHHADNS